MSAIKSALLTLLEPGEELERCGLVMKTGEVLELHNISEDPKTSFRMDPKALIKHADDAVATWHTHPDSDPNLSERDYAGFLNWPSLEHYIVGWRQGAVTVVGYKVEHGLVVAL